jgi:hypothetical protein
VRLPDPETSHAADERARDGVVTREREDVVDTAFTGRLEHLTTLRIESWSES